MKTVLLFVLSLLLLGGRLQVEGLLDNSLFDDCNRNATCFLALPSACGMTCTGPDCQLVAIIHNLPSVNKFRIQLHSTEDFSYMALGFSLDNQMPNSDVVGCQKSDVSTAHAKDTFNVQVGRQNEYDTDQSAISSFTYNINGSKFSCIFERAYQSPDPSRGHTLNVGRFVLFLAAGIPGSFGYRGSTSNFQKHYRTPCMSNPVDLLNPNPITSQGRDLRLELAHGLLMMFAWAVLIKIGIFMATYTKYIFPNGEWLHAHKFLNLSAVIIAIIAFIIIFVSVRGWSTGSNSILAHQIFGIAAVVIMLVNPILAVFRCRPKAESRWIFNLLHGVLGCLGLTFAFVAIGLGLSIYYSFMDKGIWQAVAFWVYIGWVVTMLAFDCLLIGYLVYKCLKENSKTKEELLKKEPLPDKNPFEIIIHNIFGFPLCPPKDERKKSAKEWPIIGFVLILFIVCTLLFYAACVITLILA